MRFFTPQLVADFGSDDPAIADRADREWELAIEEYRKHVGQLPPKIKEFAESICLHDAQYLGISKVGVLFVEGGPAVVTLKHQDQFVFLFYVLAAEPTLEPAHTAGSADTSEVLWLYDEIDVDANGSFVHEILLSNAKILKLHFVFVAFGSPVVEKLAGSVLAEPGVPSPQV